MNRIVKWIEDNNFQITTVKVESTKVTYCIVHNEYHHHAVIEHDKVNDPKYHVVLRYNGFEENHYFNIQGRLKTILEESNTKNPKISKWTPTSPASVRELIAKEEEVDSKEVDKVKLEGRQKYNVANIEIKLNGFKRDDIKLGDVLTVTYNGGSDRFMVISALTDNSGKYYDLLDVTEGSSDYYMPVGLSYSDPWSCIKHVYNNRVDFISVELHSLEVAKEAEKFAYENGFTPRKSMTIEQIEEALGYKINLI